MDRPVLRRGRPDDLDRLLPLVAAYHAFESFTLSDDERRRSVAQLLNDPALGAIWCIETSGEMVGYIAICFGYAIEFGGRDAFIDEFYLVPEARGKGIGRRVLEEVKARAAEDGVAALHLEVKRGNDAARRVYERHGFHARSDFQLMTVRLRRPA